jgi:hypothetical protein
VKLLSQRFGEETLMPRGKSLAPLNKEAGKKQRDKVSKLKDARSGSYVKRTDNKDTKRKS